MLNTLASLQRPCSIICPTSCDGCHEVRCRFQYPSHGAEIGMEILYIPGDLSLDQRNERRYLRNWRCGDFCYSTGPVALFTVSDCQSAVCWSIYPKLPLSPQQPCRTVFSSSRSCPFVACGARHLAVLAQRCCSSRAIAVEACFSHRIDPSSLSWAPGVHIIRIVVRDKDGGTGICSFSLLCSYTAATRAVCRSGFRGKWPRWLMLQQ